MSATNPRGAVLAAAVVGAAAEPAARSGHAVGCQQDHGGRWCAVGTAAAVDRCPMGGEHDPGDSDRPCPRCGASPR